MSPPAPTNHVALVIDKSGSMQSVRSQVVDVFNDNLTTIKTEVYKNTTSDGKSDQLTTLTSVLFSDQANIRFVAQPIDSLRAMALDEYVPSGGTALLQAVGETIEALEKVPEAKNATTSFLIITITDGEENASAAKWETALTAKMRTCQATDRWSFVFLVPDENAKHELVRKYGIPYGNVTVWAATKEGTKKAGESISRGISRYYSSRARGERSVREFFRADLSAVKKKDLTKLEDLSGEAKVLPVTTGEVEIKTFCEEKLRAPYIKGAAFYELSKPETVQSYKKIAIKERNGKKIYGGDDARHLLGLPDGDTRVFIDNLSNYQVFIQSTSVNRKLVRGTSVLYIPSLA